MKGAELMNENKLCVLCRVFAVMDDYKLLSKLQVRVQIHNVQVYVY